MLIGISGRGGSGKSTFAKQLILKHPEYEYIEVDKLIEQKVLNSERLINNVNSKFIDKKYTIEDIVKAYFKFDLKSKELHNCFLEEVELVIHERLLRINKENAIVEWFLLHRLSSFDFYDIKIYVETEREIRIKRAIQRNDDLSTFLEVDEHYLEGDKKIFDIIVKSPINSKEINIAYLKQLARQKK